MRQVRLEMALVSALLGASACTPPEPFEPAVAQHGPMIIRESRNANVTSTNWSGYAVTAANGSVTDVKGSWIVPAIVGTCPATNQYSSFWVGIDGYNSNTVEQIGTDSDCENGVPTYYAWFEFYPHASYMFTNFSVSPGDNIVAETSYGSGRFTVSITNLTTNQSVSTSSKVGSAKRSSAEWIAEAPSSGGVLPLADFGTVSFGASYTTDANTNDATVSGTTGPIGSFGANVQQITMVNSSGQVKAQPSALTADGSSFTDDWVSAQ
jgi:hypothetical protein